MNFNRNNVPTTIEVDFSAEFSRDEVIQILMDKLTKDYKLSSRWSIDDVNVEASSDGISARFDAFKIKGKEIHKVVWPTSVLEPTPVQKEPVGVNPPVEDASQDVPPAFPDESTPGTAVNQEVA